MARQQENIEKDQQQQLNRFCRMVNGSTHANLVSALQFQWHYAYDDDDNNDNNNE